MKIKFKFRIRRQLKLRINKFLLAIVLIIIIFNLFMLIKSQLIIPISKDINSYYVKIFFDNEKKKSEFVKINMALDLTFIPLSKNYSSKSNSDAIIYSENEIIEVNDIEYNTKVISMNNFFFEENNINLNNFKFFYICKKDIDKEDINKDNKIYSNLFDGQLGLSPIYDDNNYNLLYILKKQNIISQMSFGLFLGKNKNNNYLFFGSIDKNKNEIFKAMSLSHIIPLDKKLLKKYNKWGTKIEALVVEKKNEIIKHTKHKYFAYFNTIEDRIFVPDKILEYIISRIFNSYIKNNICFITEYSEKKFINCKKNKIIEEKDNFPSIIFVIKKYAFKLTFDDLFIESIKETELIFIIQKNYYDIDTSIILFGSRFFKKYLIEFDLDLNAPKISIHSDKILPTINLDNIEDDFWRDMVRDYNKETEHYDSNYGHDEEDTNNNNDDTTNIKSDKNGRNNTGDNANDGDKNKKIKFEIEYNFLYKLIFVLFFVVIIFAGICVCLHYRKKIRYEKEKKYFNQPLNEVSNNEKYK